MRFFYRQLGLLLLAFMIWYVAVYAISLLAFPETRHIDTGAAERTIYGTEAQVAALAVNDLQFSEQPLMIFLGASNVVEGFRPNEVARQFPGYEIHNMGIGASNFTQMTQVFEMIRLNAPKSVLRKSVIVLGSWYGVYVDDQQRWWNKKLQSNNSSGMTDVENEYARSGLYSIKDRTITPRLPNHFIPAVIRAQRPFIFIYSDCWNLYLKEFLYQSMQTRSFDFGLLLPSGRPAIPTDKPRNPKHFPVLTSEYKAYRIKYWKNIMNRDSGILSAEQFERLTNLCAKINAAGAQCAIVDLPIPEYHCKGSDFFRDYQKRKVAYFAKAVKQYSAKIIDIQDICTGEKEFRDDVHPHPSMTWRWSAMLRARWEVSPGMMGTPYSHSSLGGSMDLNTGQIPRRN